MMKTFDKYGLFNLVISAVESGKMMLLNVLKKNITNAVKVNVYTCVLKPHALCTQLLASAHNVLNL